MFNLRPTALKENYYRLMPSFSNCVRIRIRLKIRKAASLILIRLPLYICLNWNGFIRRFSLIRYGLLSKVLKN